MLNGAEIFELMDSKGLPLEIINIRLRECNMAFDVIRFVEAALASGNFSYEKIKRRLIESALPEYRDAISRELDGRLILCLK